MTLQFDKIARAPAYQKIARAIEEKIVGGALQPGDALPAETALADQFGVNRATVREGLRQLEMAGLIARTPGQKPFSVARPDPGKIAAGVSRALKLNEVTFAEVWEAMMEVEPVSARLAAERIDAERLAELDALIAGLRTEGTDYDASVDQVVAFFGLLAAATQNRALEMVQAPLSELLRPSLMLVIGKVAQARGRIKKAQREIYRALAEHNGEDADGWMRLHIRDFKRGYELAGIALDTPIPLG